MNCLSKSARFNGIYHTFGCCWVSILNNSDISTKAITNSDCFSPDQVHKFLFRFFFQRFVGNFSASKSVSPTVAHYYRPDDDGLQESIFGKTGSGCYF